MSIRHTVVFTLIHDCNSDAEADFLATGRRELTSIPGVVDFEISRQVSAKSDMAWQFAMSFATQADYDAYNEHPTHVAFVSGRWVPEVSAFQEYDFITH